MHKFPSPATLAIALLCAFAAATTATLATAATPQSLLDEYARAAGQAPDAKAGATFFRSAHGREWSCSSCHSSNPAQSGQHANTAKVIAPLAPAANTTRFTDAAKTEKWFRRNCNDVLGRECSAREKADVLAWLLTVRAQ